MKKKKNREAVEQCRADLGKSVGEGECERPSRKPHVPRAPKDSQREGEGEREGELISFHANFVSRKLA